MKRLQRVEQVIPAVKQFYCQKKVNIDFRIADIYIFDDVIHWFGDNDEHNNIFVKH